METKTRDYIMKYLNPEAQDALDTFDEALKVIGTDDFVYSKVKDFEEIPGNGNYPSTSQVELYRGFDSVPERFRDDIKELLKGNMVPYAVIDQGIFINYLVVDSDANYDDDFDYKGLGRRYTLPRQNGMDFLGYAYVRNLDHPEYRLDHGNIGFANLGDVISRTV